MRDGGRHVAPHAGQALRDALALDEDGDRLRRGQEEPASPHDIIMFQTSPIMALGTSSFQNRCHLVTAGTSAPPRPVRVGCEISEW